MNLIYITSGTGPVFQSQVVELLNYIANNKRNMEITLLVGIRDDAQKEQVINLDTTINLHFFKTSPQYPILDLLMQRSLGNLLRKLDITDKTLFHVRGEYMGIIFYKAFKNAFGYDPNLFMDIRGASYEEIASYLKQRIWTKIKLHYLKSLFAKYVSKAKLVNVVSEELKLYVMAKYGFLDQDIVINHCIAGEGFCWDKKIRENIRCKLKVAEKETLFVFSSSTGGKWQNGDEIAMTLARQGYKILMLTKKSYSHKNIISMFVPYNEVPHYLLAADIGIILRDHDVVNKVSSPIKFSEYLSCGLPVIANDSVTLISDILQKYNRGIIVDDLEQMDENIINHLLSMDRAKIADTGKQLFSIETIADEYIKTYNRLESVK